MGENIMKVVRKYYDNKLDNMGNHNSFVWYGPRWAQASTAPSKLYKMYSTEGGIRVPFVVQWAATHELDYYQLIPSGIPTAGRKTR